LAIERWDPYAEMARFQDLINRMFGEAFRLPWRLAPPMGYTLPVDVCEMDDEYLVRAVVPGVRPEDLDISVKEDTVTIRGELKAPEWMEGGQQPAGQTQQQPTGRARAQRGATCWLQEIPYGRFTRTITLPTAINASNAKAEFENGILTLHLPKTEEAKPRRIEVRAGAQRQQIGTGTEGQTGQH